MSVRATASAPGSPADLPLPEDPIAENLRRWLKFCGCRDGAVFEFQAFKIPGQYRKENRFAHATDAKTILRLAREAERFNCPGVYTIVNDPKPEVATRVELGKWHVLEKGESTSNNDIEARRVLYIDFDWKRPKNTSTTDEQLQRTLEVAEAAAERIGRSVPPTSVGSGMSGNGGAVFVALDMLPESEELHSLIVGIVLAVKLTGEVGKITVDTSVTDAKRVGPVFGTTKRKGAPNLAERPHRQTYFRCADEVHRVGMPELKALLGDLRASLTAEQNAEVDKAMGIKPAAKAGYRPKAKPGDTIWSLANDVNPREVWGKLDNATCPNGHGDGESSFAPFIGDTERGFKCQHDSCQKYGKDGYWSNVDFVAQVKRIDAVTAAKVICGWFGIEMPQECGATRKGDRKLCTSTDLLDDGHCKYHQAKSNTENATSASPVAESAERWDPPVGFDEFDLPPFPVQVLPCALREFVEAESIATQTPPDLTAMMALAACSAALAKKFKFRSWYTVPANIYVACAMVPGARKSAVTDDAKRPLEEWSREKAVSMAKEIALAQQRYQIKQKEKTRAEDKVIKTQGAEREEWQRTAEDLAIQLLDMTIPQPPQLLADDCTPEKLVSLMTVNGGRMAVISPEGGPFDDMAGKYSKEANLNVYLKAHAGDTIRVDRHGRPSEFIQAPALTLGLAVQPEVLLKLGAKGEFRGRGLLGRFLYSIPLSNMGRRDVRTPQMPEGVARAYDCALRRLLAIEPAVNDAGEYQPRIVQLNPEAVAMMESYERWVEPQLAEFGEMGGFQDWGSKLGGATLRILGILGILAIESHFEDPSIYMGGPIAEAAISIGRYLIPHAKAAYTLMGTNEKVEDAKHCWRYIESQRWERFTRRELQQGLKGSDRFREVERLDRALGVLEELGYIRREKSDEPSGKGRPRGASFRVYPARQKSHNSQKSTNAVSG